ncbi:MAG: lytic murein transglycosylase B [Gammaproteobacteria bacterium]
MSFRAQREISLRRHLGCVLVALTLGTASAHAATTRDYPEIESFIDDMVQTHSFKRPALKRVFDKVRIRSEIVTTMDRPREGLPWFEYQRSFLAPQQVRNGKQYWREHAKALARAEREYGVPAEIIVAIIGIETQYGRNTGDYPIIDALSTLAFAYPRRADYFRDELKEFLLLTREHKLNPLRPRGSYAGAIGIPQFMPSSYRRYAVDFDRDKRRDLFKSNSDAIGSVAQFLREHGWERGEPVLDEARLERPEAAALEELGLEPVLSVRQLMLHGVYPQPFAFLANAEPGERRAALVVLEGEAGPLYRLGYANFYAITRYNRSKRYAAAVVELGQAIRRSLQEEP